MEDLNDVHKYIILALATVISWIGFFLKRVIGKVDDLEHEVADQKVNNSEKFATKREVKDAVADLKDHLKEVLTPMNRKLESIEDHMRKRPEDYTRK